MSSLEELQDCASRVAAIYCKTFDAPDTAEFALLKLSEELGEMTGAWLQMQGQGRGSATQQDLADEVADVLGFLLVFAQRSGIDPAQALMQKWGKYLPKEDHDPDRD